MNKRTYIDPSLSGQSHKNLWSEFLEGNEHSFELIYREYADILFRYGIQFTKDQEIVKDAIHDVFVNIYLQRQQLKQEVHVKFYLFTALKNRLYNIFRREPSFEQLDEKEVDQLLVHATENRAISHLKEESDKEEVRKLLAQLTDRQREVIYYRYLEEMEMDEICSLMDMNYQSVQNLIQRSLKRLRSPEGLPCWFLPLLFRDMIIIGYC